MPVDLLQLKRTYDKSNMYEAILGFPTQISDSIEKMKNWQSEISVSEIQNILILGMGGSAIGGDITKVILHEDCPVPIYVNRSYHIPKWVSPHTLVFASSYSGNTEETINALGLCMARRARIIALTTGGKLKDIAEEKKFDIINMTGGLQPRAALGYSFTLLLLAMIKLGFGKDNLIHHLQNSVTRIQNLADSLSQFNTQNYAVKISKKIYKTIPVIYGSEDLTWVAALRFRGQLAENSKMIAFHHHIPEQNHNEIEGWNSNPELLKNCSIIWLPDQDDHPRISARMDITRSLLEDLPSTQINITASGTTKLVRLLMLIHIIDWISYYTALLHQSDPSPVNRIMTLKEKMSKID